MEQPSSENNPEQIPVKEIEQKYLLASEDDAKRLEKKLKQLFPESHLVGNYSETSYYYSGISKEQARFLLEMVTMGSKAGIPWMDKLENIPETMPIIFRLRTRKGDDETYATTSLTFKAGQNPLHGEERTEIEINNISPRFLDIFSPRGFNPTSVWHSNRKIYVVDTDTKVDIQNVTGYGWTAEIESGDISKVQEIAHQLGLEPLTPAVLDKMYNRYKENWEDYYEGEGEARHFSSEDWTQIETASKERARRNEVSL